MFIGREREIGVLEKRYASEGFEFVGLYGRRRVGKTTLLGEFVRDKPCVFFTAIEGDPQANLRLLSQSIYQLDNPDLDPALAPVYSDFSAAIEAVFVHARNRRIVFVIDEFPYVAKAYPALPSIIQAAIDRNKEASKLFLVLCGSSLSFMKEQLMGRESPLYGRKTAQIELRPFDFFDSRRFFPDVGFATALELYSMVGGIPLYLRQLDSTKTTEENVASAFLDVSSILYDEPTNLLKQEVSKAPTYHSVISAIAGGASRHNEIATQAGLESAGLDYYLKELVRLELIEKEMPIVRGGRGVWHVTDHLFRFWYRFIRSRQPMVERGLGDRAAGWIAQALPEYVGFVFEEVCRDWLWRTYANGSLGIDIGDIGRWWGNDPIAKEQAEVDVVAVRDGVAVLVGECKWRAEATGADVLSKLDARARLVGAGASAPRLVFSKAGFAEGCRELAETLPGARLISLSDMEQ